MNVLLLGLDPHKVPGVDGNVVDMALAMGQKRFDDAGIRTDTCLLTLDETVKSQIVTALSRTSYSCVVIGGGVRKPDEMVSLLETCIDLVRRHAPEAAIAFNTNPVTSLDAVRRRVG